MTVMLYLNAPARGGETAFLDPHEQDLTEVVAPRAGRALVFDHRLLHEGSLLREGRKYAIRTDVMYARDPAATGAETGSDSEG